GRQLRGWVEGGRRLVLRRLGHGERRERGSGFERARLPIRERRFDYLWPFGHLGRLGRRFGWDAGRRGDIGRGIHTIGVDVAGRRGRWLVRDWRVAGDRLLGDRV